VGGDELTKSLAIVGAGAKAAAVAARNATLTGILKRGAVPDLHIFEKDHVGCAWSGAGSFTSGFLTLCTPGERDVGFPYDEVFASWRTTAPVSPGLFARFSWGSWLAQIGAYSDWVDRGRDHPFHAAWADYLQWVLDEAGQQPIFAEVTRVAPGRKGRWTVFYGNGSTLEVDGVLFSGTGSSRLVPKAGRIPRGRVLNAETFWREREKIRARRAPRIAVAGDGGSAGTIVAWLAEAFAETGAIIYSISPMGTLFPRGDGYVERRWFSDPTDWRKLDKKHREKLLERTEAGVISLRIKAAIDRATVLTFLRGKADLVRWDPINRELVVATAYGADTSSPRVDYFVNAIGFDSWSLLRVVDHPVVKTLLKKGSESLRKDVEMQMAGDLSLPTSLGMPAGLHVPALAGLARGPGMGNLGSLGLMAKAVHDRYIA
jgi:mycobactin lysine-N-oxygenase